MLPEYALANMEKWIFIQIRQWGGVAMASSHHQKRRDEVRNRLDAVFVSKMDMVRDVGHRCISCIWNVLVSFWRERFLILGCNHESVSKDVRGSR
jgi:hypothetical protein